MENLDEYIGRINKHSFVHLGLSAFTSGLAVLFMLILEHWPLVLTLIVTSIVTFCSGLTGCRLKSNTKVSLIKIFFILQVILLCSWDFGGVVCVITIGLGYRTQSLPIFIIIIVCSCLVYIGAFIYFWKCFIIVNRLMILIKNPKRHKSASFISNTTKIVPTTAPLLNPRTLSSNHKLQDTTHTINSGSVVSQNA